MKRMCIGPRKKDEGEGNLDSSSDNEPTFSSSYFLEKHIVNVETI